MLNVKYGLIIYLVMEFDEEHAVLPEDEYFNVSGTVSMIDIVKAADFLIVMDRVTKHMTDTYMSFPSGQARRFYLNRYY